MSRNCGLELQCLKFWLRSGMEVFLEVKPGVKDFMRTIGCFYAKYAVEGSIYPKAAHYFVFKYITF